MSAAIDRLAAIRKEQGEGDFSAYAFLALALLGYEAPDVLEFILDRTDDALKLDTKPAERTQA